MDYVKGRVKEVIQKYSPIYPVSPAAYWFAFVLFVQKTSPPRKGTKLLYYQVILPKCNKWLYFKFQIHSDIIGRETGFALL